MHMIIGTSQNSWLIYVHIISLKSYTHALLSFHCDCLSAGPEDYSSATRHNVTFRQTVFTDGDDPARTALSSPILINITYDDIFEGAEYFQARIVETSDRFAVRIGPQDTVNVTITENDSELFISLEVLHQWLYIRSNSLLAQTQSGELNQIPI